MKFSISMPVYNHIENCERAILSIINQSYTDWELIILDNASESPDVMTLIRKYEKEDSRIKGFRIEHNVGWPKGVSLCLERATGDYFGFIAADDFLEPDGLKRIVDTIGTSHPEIIWMGNKEDFIEAGKTVDILPPFQRYDSTLEICENLKVFLSTVYYNAMHHFIDLDFLRKNHIDFFSPYYSDCGSMTRALSVAEKMIVLDQSPYHLIRGTSHSTGKYLTTSCRMFLGQFSDTIGMFFRTGYFNKDILTYCSHRFENNHLGMIRNLCAGGSCQDEYFDSIDMSWSKRLREIEIILGHNGFENTMYYFGAHEFFSILMNSLLLLTNKALSENYSFEEITSESRYLVDIMTAMFKIEDRTATLKSALTLDDITLIIIAVLHEDNRLLFGFSNIELLLADASPDIISLFERALIFAKKKKAALLQKVLLFHLNGYSRGVLSLYTTAYSDFLLEIIGQIDKLGTSPELVTELSSLCSELIKEANS